MTHPRRTALTVTLLLALTSGCALTAARTDWSVATTEDTVESYSRFISDHPDSKYAAEGRMRIDWLQAKAEDTAESYRGFVSKHPNSEFTTMAAARASLRAKAEKRERENARRWSLLDSYRIGDSVIRFLADGWNATDPKNGLLGIVEERREGRLTFYAIGVAPQRRRTGLVPEGTSELFRDFVMSSEGSAHHKVLGATVFYELLFKNDMLISSSAIPNGKRLK